MLEGSIVVIGNAPTALPEISRLVIEEGLRPALVIGVPVGFVHVEESKEELMELGVPFITLTGRRGGSPIAVSIVHALCSLASLPKEVSLEYSAKKAPMKSFDAIIILGHGSRVPDAGRSMEVIAEELRRKNRCGTVKTAYMSRLGPHFDEVLEACVNAGAQSILLLPYFLNEGMHIKVDIPSMMKVAVNRYPQIKLVFSRNLGFDSLLLRLVEKRIEESQLLPEVTQLAIPDEDAFPLPTGQYEFVPMLPNEVASWKISRAEKASEKSSEKPSEQESKEQEIKEGQA